MENLTISDDKSLLNLDAIHHFLSNSYWAKDIPKASVQLSIDNSLCFGMYQDDQQIGFARVITDQVTFAYLSDVFILPSHQGKGLGKKLVKHIIEQPSLSQLRNFLLGTADAHGLYQQLGFKPLSDPERIMAIHQKNPVYRQA